MAEPRNSLSNNGNGERSSNLNDVVLKRADKSSEGGDRSNLAILRVFGLREETEKAFPLHEISPGRWAMSSAIELPQGVMGIKCVVKGEGGKDTQFTHVHCAASREGVGEGPGGPIKLLDAQLHIPASWRAVQIWTKPATNRDSASIQALCDHWETLYNQFKTTGNLTNISEAISTLHRVVEITPMEDQNLATVLSSLGCSLCRQFEHTGDLSDIAEAITVQIRSVGMTPDGHADLPSMLNNLGNSFLRRFERLGTMADVAKAISLQSRAVDLTPEGHADLPSRLMNLGGSFLQRFEHKGNLCDVAEAISLQSRAVDLTPRGHADLPDMLVGLGGSFLQRFGHMGDLLDVAEAISLQSRAVCLTPGGHASLPSRLDSLGSSFQARFERTCNLTDISQAISVHTQAVELTPEGHAQMPAVLNNLGNSFLHRFQHTGDLPDATQAISALSQAASLTPEGHPGLPSRLMNLGIAFTCCFEHTGELCEIKVAVFFQKKAVHLTPIDDASLPHRLSNLGGSLMRCFECTGNPDDVTEGIYNLSQALHLTPDMHTNLPSRFINLASAWYQYFTSSHNQGHLAAAVSNFKSAATCATGSSHVKIEAAIRWARLSSTHYYPPSLDVLDAFKTAIDLLVLTAGLEQTVQHRFAMIERHGRLPAEAATVAFGFGQPHTALEWLEQGRCLVWSQQSQLRTPLTSVKVYNQALAERIVEVSRCLQAMGSSRQHSGTNISLAGKVSLEDEALKHTQLAMEWVHLLAEVRGMPGLDSFLQPLKCHTILQHLPQDGPIIILNVYEDWCDAIALLAGLDEPIHIPLPNFSLKKARDLQRNLNIQLRSHQLRARGVETTTGDSCDTSRRAAGQFQRKGNRCDEDVHLVLVGLWNEVVKPILNALGFSKNDGSYGVPLPRIWWCPTGPLSFLPLHAAGIYKGPIVEGIMDYVVSSYTPTVTALTQRVQNGSHITKDASGLFLTSQPKAPGAVAIPGTTQEVILLHNSARCHGIRALKLEGTEVSANRCPDLMERFSSIHLACHASQNSSNPLQSRFLFHDGHLTLNTIMQKNLKNADLAFLSACETSTGEETLADEAVHLAAGMLAAGYRRVVATMWSIDDGHAPQVANDFYEYLWARRGKDSGTGFDGTLSAYALHHATQELRGRLDNMDSSLLAWIPYVHFGY